MVGARDSLTLDLVLCFFLVDFWGVLTQAKLPMAFP